MSCGDGPRLSEVESPGTFSTPRMSTGSSISWLRNEKFRGPNSGPMLAPEICLVVQLGRLKDLLKEGLEILRQSGV